MAVGRLETILVLGLIGAVACAAALGIHRLSQHPPAATTVRTSDATLELPARAAPSPVAEAGETSTPPAQAFVATVENESIWRPDLLPVAWPRFSKLPDEKPLPAKPTKLKLDSAKSLLARWDAFVITNKDLPSDEEAGAAIKYLLTIDRGDPAFPEAWALFIKVRVAALDISKQRTLIAGRQALQKEAESRKRNAKTQGVHVGMTQAEVLGSNWGKPRSVNTTITAGGKHEQWVYGGTNYLYFQDGMLTSIQTGQ